MASKSSIQKIMFYMQSKEMFKLTPQLCRLARKEYEDTNMKLPEDVREEMNFNKVLRLIEHLEHSEFAKANETLGDAYKEYEEMMSYFTMTPKKRVNRTVNESQSIFDEKWEPPFQPETMTTFPDVNRTIAEDNEIEEDEMDEREKSLGDVNDENENDYHDKDQEPSYSILDKNLHRPSKLTTINFNFGNQSKSPKKLAEEFTELYENEWREAHDELESILGEKQTVRHMLWIIAKSSIICASLATEQLADLENSITGIMVSRDPFNKESLVDESLATQNEQTIRRHRSLLVQYRREIAVLSVSMLQKEIKRAIASELGTSLPKRFTGIGNKFICYAEKCIALIWFMYVRDPPMHLEWLTKEQEGSVFNTDHYSPYTTPAALFDYCVWPIVRQHKNGPILRKGIAQGR